MGGDRAGSLTSAIQGQCGRQAGEQLYYSSGMAGSAEGEALTPILMRLRSAVTKRMQEDEAETISQLV